MDVSEPHVGFALFAEQLLMIRDVEDRDAQRAAYSLELQVAAGPPHAVSPDEDWPLCLGDQIQNRCECRGIWPCARNRPGSANERTLLLSRILVERGEHDVDG